MLQRFSKSPYNNSQKKSAIAGAGAIRKWFANTGEFLRNENLIEILKDPSRILNGDEIFL